MILSLWFQFLSNDVTGNFGITILFELISHAKMVLMISVLNMFNELSWYLKSSGMNLCMICLGELCLCICNFHDSIIWLLLVGILMCIRTLDSLNYIE
jgi:hypothetical protein